MARREDFSLNKSYIPGDIHPFHAINTGIRVKNAYKERPDLHVCLPGDPRLTLVRQRAAEARCCFPAGPGGTDTRIP